MNRHIWEGWTVNDFINELEPMFDMIMKGNSHVNPFKSRGEVQAWCMNNQPYYKKHIPEVVNYFEQKRLELNGIKQ
jgi:hypothetical protein